MMKCRLANKCEYGDMCKPNYEIGGCSHFKTKRKKTNFQRITASPEALASWLDEHAEFCAEISCDECYVKDECWKQGCNVDFCSNAKRWLNWLKQESMQESE